MTRFIRSISLVILFMITTIFSCKMWKKDHEDTPVKQNQPNIIFFIADDMRPGMFNFLPEGKGKNLTPNLDRLAEEGTIMMNQYVVSPVCTPSRFNCLTGKYASRAKNEDFLDITEQNEGQTVVQWNTHVIQGDMFLPIYLKEAGYVTGIAGKNHVIDVKGLHTFPDFNADPRSPEIRKKIEENYRLVQKTIMESGFDFADGIYHDNPWWLSVDELAVHNLDWIAAAGVEFINKNHDKPFFLYFAPTVPHGPGVPERSWNADPTITAAGFLDEPPEVLPARHTIPERIKEAGMERRENILWLDDALGALIKQLEQYNILDNTIIFFFNDHGQMGKGTLYQGGIYDPSVIWKSGGFPCGEISQAKITNVDFAPTILDLAGIEVPENTFDGISFKGVLNGEATQSRESLYFELGFGRAVIKGKYKYYALRYPEYANNWTVEERMAILQDFNELLLSRGREVYVNEDPTRQFSHIYLVPGGGDAERRSYGEKPAYFDLDQLYDLEADPDEMVNMANDPKYQDTLEDMKAELQKYLDKLPGKFEL
jgi:arylsulfatase A-like enzyme